MLHFDKNVEQKDFELVKPGDYEVIMNLEWAKTRISQEQYINCSFKIRKDVKQDFGGQIIFDGIYKSKNNADEFQASKINAILAALPNSKSDFESYDELIQYLNDKCLLVRVEVQKADPKVPNSKDRNVIAYLSYRPTKHPIVEDAPKDTDSKVDSIKIDEDDLPF